MSTPIPTERQLDALREVANVGCGHAANALSRLVGGKKVQLDVPSVALAHVEDLAVKVGGGERRLWVAVLTLQGELKGKLLLVHSDEDARRLSSALVGTAAQGELDELHRSALGEAANIVASACLSAMGDFTGLRLLPSVPALLSGPAVDVLSGAVNLADGKEGLLLVLEARFQTAGPPAVGGQLLVLPERESLSALLARLGV